MLRGGGALIYYPVFRLKRFSILNFKASLFKKSLCYFPLIKLFFNICVLSLIGVNSIFIILKNIILTFFVSLLLYACAKPGTLGGGPRDITPPKLDTIKSTPNFKTNFKPEKITLYFDEWISLKQKNQIFVSPPLTKKIDITQRGKHIDIKFDKEDTLKANTTYNINFGKSIVDFTEGNPAKDLLYVFSTGDVIDSLEFLGSVVNSADNKPLKDIFVMLYEVNEDSIVAKSKPYYSAVSDERGNFRIKYIKEGYYKLFALGDENSNYLYDLETEKIGYIDTMVHIFYDSIPRKTDIKMFTPIPDLRIVENSVAGYGKIKIVYNREPLDVKINSSSVTVLDKKIQKDSFLIFYDNTENPDSVLLVLEAENTVDSLKLKLRKKFSIPDSLLIVNENSSVKIHPDAKINIEFNQPIHWEDATKIEIFENTGVLKNDTTSVRDTNKIFVEVNSIIDSTNNSVLKISGKWKEGKKYTLAIYPEYVKSLFEIPNDTIQIDVTVEKKEKFGSINCNLDSLNNMMSYIVTLKKGNALIDETYVHNIDRKTIQYKELRPGKYQLEIIEDVNSNKRWDVGNYYGKEKPEKKYVFKLNELKSNWVQDEDIILMKNDTMKIIK